MLSTASPTHHRAAAHHYIALATVASLYPSNRPHRLAHHGRARLRKSACRARCACCPCPYRLRTRARRHAPTAAADKRRLRYLPQRIHLIPGSESSARAPQPRDDRPNSQGGAAGCLPHEPDVQWTTGGAEQELQLEPDLPGQPCVCHGEPDVEPIYLPCALRDG